MKEELEKEITRLKELIEKYDEQHKKAARMANMYRRQLKTAERELGNVPEQSAAESIIEVSEGLKNS